jgi:hypothetical protein
MNSMTESEGCSPRFKPWKWIAALLAFPLAHALCMAIDWRLRPANPMVGGIPDAILTAFQWGSVGLLFVALCLAMPRSWAIWIRALLALVQTIPAFFLMVFAWLYYVLSNGIDTL